MDIERQLTGIAGRKWVFSGPAAQRLYSHDTSAFHGLPQLVVLPGDREQVAAVLAACTQAGVPVTPRGAGTCLSGGPVPVQGGIVLALTRLNHILHLDPVESLAVVEPGVTNQQLQKAAARHGLMFPPDPASQRVSTLGGNVAENAGGPRAFKYGVTRNYVLALEYTLPDGTVQETRWDAGNGPDLTSLLVGSEGTLAVLTRLALRLVPLPTHYLTLTVCFATVEQACRTVSEVVAAGMLPLALEIMGQVDINLVEDYLHLGLPREAAALLLIELEGPGPSLDRQAQVIEAIARSHGGSGIKYASDEREREQLWLARKSAAGTYGRLKPTYITQDVTVPRPCIPALFETISELATEIGLPISILGHMGDGNLHPAVLFDDQDPEERERTLRAGEAIVEAALRLGGSLTGEHGVGVEKLPFLPQAYPAPTLRYFAAIKRAFDPQGLLNPGKAIISPWPLPPAPTPSEAREAQPDAVLAELEGWLGDNLVSDPSRIASLGFPPDHMPEAVAFPADRIQLAETVRLLADSRIPIWPVGSASLLHTAFRPFRGGVAVSTARLQRVIDLDPENLTLTVEAGIPASTLNGLAKLDLHYPVDPWRTPTSTLGGEVATDAFGPSHLTYGTTRDQLLGMTFVDAQGEECVVGGRTIKNVTGYDVTRLLCGSWGTLGIVTSVTVRLWPRPEQEITCAMPLVGEKDTLSGFVQDVWRHLRPAALQLLSPLPSTPGHREWWKTWTLFVRLAGMEEDVRTWQEKLAGLVLSYRLPDLIVLPEQEAGEAWDTVRRCSGLAVRRRQAATRAGLTVCGRQAQRVGYLRVPRSASLPASFRLLAWARDRGHLPLVTCHWGLGLVDFVLSTPETRSDQPEDLPALAACFHAHLGWYGCSPAQRNEEGVAPPKGILRLIKQEVDRAGVLAPAAFILASAPDPAAGRE